MKHLLRLTLATLPWLAAPGDLLSAEPDERLVKLAPLWKSQRSEIATAHIKYRLFRAGGGDLAALGPQQVHDAILSASLGARPDELKQVVNKLLRKPSRESTPWASFESFFEGSKAKEVVHGATASTQVFDGTEKIEADPKNNQVTLLPPKISRRYMRRLTDFRNVLPPTPERFSVHAQKTGKLILRAGAGEQVVDEVTGVLYRSTARRQDGSVVQDVIQEHYASYPGGILFPSLAVQARYNRQGNLDMINLSLVEEAQFNLDLPRSTFSVKAPTSTNVFDEREPRKVRSFPLSGETEDVVQAANEQVSLKATPLRVSKSNRWLWLAISGGVAVLLVLVSYVRRRSQPAPS